MSTPYRPTGFQSIHRVLGDPLRLRLMDALWVEPRSAKDLAARLGLPPDRLYYHLRQLEGARLIEVVGYRRLPAGKLERLYGVVSTEPPGDDASPEEVAAFLGQALEATRIDINQAQDAKAEGRDRLMTFTRSGAKLSRQHFAELRAHFEQLARSARDKPDEDGVWVRLLFTLVDLQDRPSV